MIRMTKVTDFGMVLLMYIAAGHAGGIFNARDLAEATGIPQPMVSKILKLLARGGLLDSHLGVKGGYSLAAPPEQINVADLIAALEGPIALTECIDDSTPPCDIEQLCPVKSNWSRINDAVRGALEEISLAEMARPLEFRRPLERVTRK